MESDVLAFLDLTRLLPSISSFLHPFAQSPGLIPQSPPRIVSSSPCFAPSDDRPKLFDACLLFIPHFSLTGEPPKSSARMTLGEKGVKEGRGTTESVSSSVASSRTNVSQPATADRPFSPLNTDARVGTSRKADHFAERNIRIAFHLSPL